MSPAGRARPPARERIAQGFTPVEDVLYVGIGVMPASVVGLLINAGVTFAHGIRAGAIRGSDLSGASLTGTGAFSGVTLRFFDRARRDYLEHGRPHAGGHHRRVAQGASP